MDNSPAYPDSFEAADWASAFLAEYPQLEETDTYKILVWFVHAIAAGYEACENGIQLYEPFPTPHRH